MRKTYKPGGRMAWYTLPAKRIEPSPHDNGRSTLKHHGHKVTFYWFWPILGQLGMNMVGSSWVMRKTSWEYKLYRVVKYIVYRVVNWHGLHLQGTHSQES